MGKKTLFTLDFFQSFQNKEAFFERITDEKQAKSHVLHNLFMLFLFSFVYGIIMGCYNGILQAVSSGIKVPVLLLLTFFICFPAFFMIQAIIGSKLSLLQIVSVVVSGYVLTSAIMVSFSPIVIFFLLTGNNYGFMKLLHVAIFIFAGSFGMRAIIEALKYSCEKKKIYPKIGVQVFKFWVVILAFVGAQLSWTLRPFIGNKNQPFELFRKQEGNFYQALIDATLDFLRSGPVPAEKTKGKENNPPGAQKASIR